MGNEIGSGVSIFFYFFSSNIGSVVIGNSLSNVFDVKAYYCITQYVAHIMYMIILFCIALSIPLFTASADFITLTIVSLDGGNLTFV